MGITKHENHSRALTLDDEGGSGRQLRQAGVGGADGERMLRLRLRVQAPRHRHNAVIFAYVEEVAPRLAREPHAAARTRVLVGRRDLS